MRTLRLACLLVPAALAGAGPITSTTFIDPGKQFVLGGYQRGAFRVEARNVGPVPVSIAERRPDGTLTERGQLQPRQQVTLAFKAGSAALVRNPGTQQARLACRITGDASAGMGYEELPTRRLTQP